MTLFYRSLGDNFVYICDVVDAKKTDQIIITPFIKENGIKIFPDNINAFDWNSVRYLFSIFFSEFLVLIFIIFSTMEH